MILPQHNLRQFDRPFLDLDPVMLLSTLLVGVLLTLFLWTATPSSVSDVASLWPAEGARR
ncbi:MAG: hypothetical protein WD823_09620 [Sulfuricaulis sp.]|uniref:hypothetical protein n=1 Tax=Sulfuricaulis sp. TaxID=2003553 RepID=UPI0034A4E682